MSFHRFWTKQLALPLASWGKQLLRLPTVEPSLLTFMNLCLHSLLSTSPSQLSESLSDQTEEGKLFRALLKSHVPLPAAILAESIQKKTGGAIVSGETGAIWALSCGESLDEPGHFRSSATKKPAFGERIVRGCRRILLAVENLARRLRSSLPE